MSTPTSQVFARKLHEAGLIPDPNTVQSIAIEAADGAGPVRLITTVFLDSGQLDVIVRELKGIDT